MLNFDKFLSKASEYQSSLDQERLRKAFEYAKELHTGKYVPSGDPYTTHLVAVADLLLPLKPDEDTLVAALLHGAVESEKHDEETFKELFGEHVHFLVSSFAELKRIIKSSDQKIELENIRKLFVTIAKDIRVVLIKMADRLHYMQMLSFKSTEEQRQFARDTLDIYVPISARFGIYYFKTLLEDTAFQYLWPDVYDDLYRQREDYITKREKNIYQSQQELKEFLLQQGISATVEGRIKNLYSIYKKLKLKTRSTLDELYDVVAMRVIVPNKMKANKEKYDHLYTILGLIHNHWEPVAERFKDYIAVPKVNGYRSLHTAVKGLGSSSQAVEIQIRSQAMHLEAEYGIASHWLYYDLNKKDFSLENLIQKNSPVRKYVDWIVPLSKNLTDFAKEKDLVKALKTDFFEDRIFVMTPDGAVKDLPHGSTPIDFAYAVHTDVGHHCQVAKVGGQVVPLDYKLENGQTVEIVTNPHAQPKSAWLSFVKTQSARAKIRSYLRGLDKERNFRQGKEIINKLLTRIHKPLLDEELTLFREYNGKRLSLKERIGLIEEVGSGTVLGPTLLKKIFGPGVRFEERNGLHQEVINSNKSLVVKSLIIAGEKTLPYRFANCCKPITGQPIIGYVTRNNEVTIHVQGCKMLRNTTLGKKLEASWVS